MAVFVTERGKGSFFVTERGKGSFAEGETAKLQKHHALRGMVAAITPPSLSPAAVIAAPDLIRGRNDGNRRGRNDGDGGAMTGSNDGGAMTAGAGGGGSRAPALRWLEARGQKPEVG